METILNHLGVGSLGAAIVLLVIAILKLLFKFKEIEVRNPLIYIRDQINQPVLDQLKNVAESQEEQKKKLDEHIAQSYRDKILNFQDKLLNRGVKGHTREEWKETITACDKYSDFVEKNDIDNEYCNLAINYIKRSYNRCLDECSFDETPNDTDTKQESE